VKPAAVIFSRRIHYRGEIWSAVTNDGSWGTQHGTEACDPDDQLLRIDWCPSFEFPGGSRVDYLYKGGLWIGGVVGTDTLVSLGYEGWAERGDEFNGHSFIINGVPPGYSSGCGAHGENIGLDQVFYCVYSDTAFAPLTNAAHIPMGLEVTQVTHQSPDNFARNFVIYDLQISNIGRNTIMNMYLSIFFDCDVFWALQSGGQTNATDDISGFLRTWPNPVDPAFDDTLNVAWAADDDGDVSGNVFPRLSPRGVMGWRILRQPEGTDLSFNWWTSDNNAGNDWGPRKATDLRDLGHGGRGTPTGDRNKYHYMRNHEIDYPQIYAARNYDTAGWTAPLGGAAACNLADGLDTRSILTVGPVELFRPGETVPLTFAIIGGKNLHRVTDNEFDCDHPEEFEYALDFSDLATSAWWAGFVFDNLGVDTDGDGYSGEFYRPVTGFDTAYYTGDGCPDFSGPSPPQPPVVSTNPDSSNLELITRPLELEVQWTGINSELKVDPLLRTRDFEGYRLYMAERNRPDDFPASDDYSLLASWDLIDYRRYTYDPRANTWEITSNPKTIEQWREYFEGKTCTGDAESFDPRVYSTPSYEDAFCYLEVDQFGQTVEKRAYFEPQDWNQGDTITMAGDTIPNVIQRIGTDTTVIGNDTLTYGIYSAILTNLLPAKHYFISVTAFDFGDPLNNLEPLETTPGVSVVDGIPIYSADVVDEYWNAGGAHKDSVRVVVYPNPYKSSYEGANGKRTSYAEQGFEGVFGQEAEAVTDADRRIHFINVPDTATIRIYSLDGDLIRELNHPDPYLSTYSSKISWDLVSRNTQAVESGIYIYRVDSRLGAQIGKLVIIK
jgi:hypothetical protein